MRLPTNSVLYIILYLDKEKFQLKIVLKNMLHHMDYLPSYNLQFNFVSIKVDTHIFNK